jgi:hypothetical protein
MGPHCQHAPRTSYPRRNCATTARHLQSAGIPRVLHRLLGRPMPLNTPSRVQAFRKCSIVCLAGPCHPIHPAEHPGTCTLVACIQLAAAQPQAEHAFPDRSIAAQAAGSPSASGQRKPGPLRDAHGPQPLCKPRLSHACTALRPATQQLPGSYR